MVVFIASVLFVVLVHYFLEQLQLNCSLTVAGYGWPMRVSHSRIPVGNKSQDLGQPPFCDQNAAIGFLNKNAEPFSDEIARQLIEFAPLVCANRR